jgi:RHS repeat-associated protein
MKLHYETAVSGLTTTADQEYNGNISAQIWQVQGKAQMGYGYQYDDLNQLSLAKYGEGSGFATFAGRFNESATYDLNGNILTMIRGGKTGTSSYGSMDNITMAYAGNKLIGANDAVTAVTGNYQFHEAMVSSVVEGNTSTHEYLYDVNGNMVEDKNKHMTVQYNFLNLPTLVDFGSGNKIEWAYTVSGAKLRKTVYTGGTVTLTQDYVSGFVYKNDSLDFFSTEIGRVKNQSGVLKYQYTLADHLGNTRVMFEETSSTPTAIEESHYYAFGMRIEGLSTTNPDNKFTYNGKELEDDHGLNWYHYGARFYDAQIGRWHVVDRLGTCFYPTKSPYIAMLNNPVVYADYEGKAVIYVVVSAKVGALYGLKGDIILAIDHQGNVAIIGEGGAGVALGAYAGLGIGGGFRFLGTVDNLKGPSLKIGGAAGAEIGGETELSIPMEVQDGKLQVADGAGGILFENYDEKVGEKALEFYLGKAGITPKVSWSAGQMAYAMMSNTWTWGEFNIIDFFKNLFSSDEEIGCETCSGGPIFDVKVIED